MGELLTQIRKDNMQAMKARDTVKKGVCSLLISSIALAEKESGKTLTKDEELTYVQKELKQTKETLETIPASRPELIEETKKKIAIIESYLPAQMSEEEVRKAIEEVPIEVLGHVTASIGVATFGEHADNLNDVLELTDQAMYTSKKNGRNRVTLANPEDLDSWQDIAVDSLVEILKNKKMPIDKEISQKLRKMLRKLDTGYDARYTVSDMLSEMYNPNHKDGSSKEKILIANMLAKRFELSKEETDKLKIAILLYDIGNMMLPKEILLKRTPLTEEEKNVIKTHPVIAAKEILQPISVIQDVIPIIEHHHENWDGSGYPNKEAGQDIPLCSQMVLIIDAYFALIEPRPYRQAKTKDEAIAIIKEGIGTKWNPKIAEEFFSIIYQE